MTVRSTVGRFLVRAALVAGGLLVVAGLVTLAPVDRSPWETSVYARAAEATVNALPALSPADSMPLRAGFGRRSLTPRWDAAADAPERGEFVSLPLAGYGQRQGGHATGVRDDLWVKAIALAAGGRTGVVVSADLLIVPREVAEAVQDRVQAGQRSGGPELYFGATHTHASLGGWGEGFVAEAFAGPFRPAVRTWMVQQLAAAVADALQDLQPAAVEAGSFDAPEFVRNRLVGELGRLNPRFHVVLVQRPAGDRAILGSYSAHATVLPSGNMEFSGDYPGAWQREVERDGRTLAVFLAGAVGSHAPRPPRGDRDGAAAMGEALASRTLEVCRGLNPRPEVVFDLVTVKVPLPPLQVRVTSEIRLRPWLARALLPVGDATRIQALRLGDAAWFSTPCDFSGELALDLEEAVTRLGLRGAVTSFNGDYVGYVVPASYYDFNAYETRTMSFFGPQMPDYLGHLLGRLVRRASTGADMGAGVGLPSSHGAGDAGTIAP